MKDGNTLTEVELKRLEAGGATIKRKSPLKRKKRNLPRTTVDNDHDHGVLENGRTTRDTGHDHALLPNGRTSVSNAHDHKWAPKAQVESEVSPPAEVSSRGEVQIDKTNVEMIQQLITHSSEVLERSSSDLQAALVVREKEPLDMTFEIIRDETVEGDYQPITGLRMKANGLH